MILWASSYIVLKIAIHIYDPFVILFGRMTVASLCFLFLIHRVKIRKIKKGSLKYILFMALCEPCLYFLFEAKALTFTTASQAGMITALLPLMVAVSARIFLRDTISNKTIAGFALTIIGACWLSYGGDSSAYAPRPVWGNFLEFIAMICATGYIITFKTLSQKFGYSPFFLTASQSVSGLFFYFPLLFLPSTTLPTTFEWFPVLAVIYLGAFITLGAYGLYNYGMSKLPVTQAATFINLIPVFTVLLGWICLGEQFNKQQYAAAILIFIGIFISQTKRR